MTGKITKTFRELLLAAPHPLNPGLYAANYNLMFPDVEHFEHFLESSRHDDQVRHARLILLRLASESAFTPTNRLILNLLDFESHLGGHRATGFVGRDHFVHLVHLYLLGLYVFWYHNGFHKSLLTYFRTQRESNLRSVGDNSADASGVGLFLTAWTNFVLMHDVFYPMEIQGGNPNYFPYIKPLGKISKNLEKEFALQCLSRLLAFQMLIDASAQTTLKESYQSDIRSGTFGRSTLQGHLFERNAFDISRWLESKKMPMSLGSSLLAVLEAIFGLPKVLMAIERSSDRRPVWLMECGSRIELILEDNLRNIKSRERLNQVLSGARRGIYDYGELDEFEIVFFVTDFTASLTEAYAICTAQSETGAADIRELAKSYARSDPVPFSVASAYRDFNDCAFHTYQAILRDLDYLLDDDEFPSSVSRLNQQFKSAKRAIKSLEKRLLRELHSHLSEQVKRRAKHLADEGYRITNENLARYITELLLPLADTKNQAQIFSSRMTHQLKRQIEADSVLRRVYAKIRSQIGKTCAFPEDDWSEHSDDCQKHVLQGWLCNSRSDVLQSLFRRLRASNRTTLESLKSYRPDYVEEGYAFVDHGIGAALLGAQIGERLLKVWREDEDQKSVPMWLATLFRSRCSGCERLILEEICYAILVHNLYPESFTASDDQQFRTRLSDSPFAFFAIFCDSLQPWDRKRLANPAYADGAYGTIADDFDVSIRGDIVYISESGYGLSIEDKLHSLRKHLDAYLESASRLVKLRLIEK